jgi:hypothetical protein
MCTLYSFMRFGLRQVKGNCYFINDLSTVIMCLKQKMPIVLLCDLLCNTTRNINENENLSNKNVDI